MSTTPPIEIFRVGTHTSAQGIRLTFSEQDLRQIAAVYDPDLFDAPLVVGHPQFEAPAYGWAERLEVQGGVLTAVPRDIDPAFAELVAAKRYKKISSEFYHPDSPANPKPGSWYLKHIGFLGAAAPAVKGLKSASFSEDQRAGCVTFETPQESTMPTPEEIAARDASFAEREASLAQREAAVAQREADQDEAIKLAQKAAKDAQHASNLSFAEAQVAAGRLRPADRALVVGLLDELPVANVVSFGEGDQKVELSPNAAFRQLFDRAQPVISFGEKAPSERGDSKATSLALPQGYAVDAATAERHAKALEIQRDRPTLSFAEAVKLAG